MSLFAQLLSSLSYNLLRQTLHISFDIALNHTKRYLPTNILKKLLMVYFQEELIHAILVCERLRNITSQEF